MKLQLIRHFWGVDQTRPLEEYLPRWQTAGYEALEVSLRQVADKDAFFKFLTRHRMGWVPQVFTHDFIPGGNPRIHLLSLEQQIQECLDFEPLFFNAHSGYDAWSLPEAEDFYGAALEMEKRIGISICHETHRSRCLGNPWTTQRILERFPALKLTCDFSHWVCVAERLLRDCGEIIQLAAEHCHHLHARVGYEQSPQVPDPRAPEWAGHLAAHELWWNCIWMAQEKRGMEKSTLTPEFGPAPYLQTLPYTQTPVADLADICDWMARRQADRFAAMNFSNTKNSTIERLSQAI